jgi:dipeptidyl aminopeptidase/acylaminoacyl peptidase
MKIKVTLPLLMLSLALAHAASAQTPVARGRASFDAEEVSIKTNGYALAGTLLLPRGARRKLPAVVMITGSGPQTRDGAIPLPGLEGYLPFKQIAEDLAARGIASLRVDDRGYAASTGRETLATATTSGLAGDTRAEVAYLRARREIDPERVALVGHSEGGAIALMLATTDARLRAVVLIAAMGKTGREVNLAQQEEALAAATALSEEQKAAARAQQREIIRTIIEGGDLSKLPPDASLPWFKEFLTYDPLSFARRVRQPLLILQGALDRQVTADQAALLEGAARGGGNRDVTARVLPGLNHLFLPAKTGAWSEYTTLQTTSLGADVLDAVGGWLATRLRAGK